MTAPRHPTPPFTKAEGSSIPIPPDPAPGARRWLKRPLVALLVAVLLAAGCSAGTQSPALPTSTPTAAPTPTPTTTASPAPTQPAYPLTLEDDEGGTVSLAARPTHIVSLSPANTEIVWALDGGDRQVAGSDADDFPSDAVGLPDVVNYLTGVDVEKIVSLDADLVLAAGNGFTPPEAVARLRSLGIPVLVVYAADVPGVLADIELIGKAIGEWPAALELSDAMDARIDAIAEAASATATRPRTFYELDATGAIFGPADGNFVVGLIELAGGDPITTGSTTVFQISLERLVAADPEVILLGDAAYGVTPEAVKQRPGWSGMTAVKNDAIRPVDDLVISRPGPRLADGLLSLARAMHPDLGI
jgi:iron complex transport system substrate-binding protein